MAHNWTSRMNRRAGALSRVFRTEPRIRGRLEIDADARRMRADLDAIRARFPDHA